MLNARILMDMKSTYSYFTWVITIGSEGKGYLNCIMIYWFYEAIDFLLAFLYSKFNFIINLERHNQHVINELTNAEMFKICLFTKKKGGEAPIFVDLLYTCALGKYSK